MNVVPDGYVAVPVFADERRASLRICVVARRTTERGCGTVVCLRALVDGRVLLGCVVDRAQRVHRWLEVSVQSMSDASQSFDAILGSVTNRSLDDSWRASAAAAERCRIATPIVTGWETRHSPPIYLDLEKLAPIAVSHEPSGETWALCDDDRLLEDVGLPAYHASSHRYLYVPGLGHESPFAAATPGAPSGDGAVKAGDHLPGTEGLVPLNPEGGFMIVRECAPMSLEAFADILGGGDWLGVRDGRVVLALDLDRDHLDPGVAAEPFGGRLFSARAGLTGRLVESLHLKLKLLADMSLAAWTHVQATHSPLLNLGPESFGVRLFDDGCALPFLWTATADLITGGGAVRLPIGQGESGYFLPAAGPCASIYRPDLGCSMREARGTVRLRKVGASGRERHVVEGTLDCPEPLSDSGSGLVWMRLPLGGEIVSLYVRVDGDSAMAAGEWRFRSVDAPWSGDELTALRRAEGVVVQNVVLRIIPHLTSACDLYSLAVLGVRLLLQGGRQLPVALDELLSMARQVSGQDAELDLSGRIGRELDRDARWLDAVGPQHLLLGCPNAGRAADLFPRSLWCDVLATLIRAVPGAVDEGPCRDYADVPEGRPEAVFERLRDDVSNLLVRTRALIAGDQEANREIRDRLTALMD